MLYSIKYWHNHHWRSSYLHVLQSRYLLYSIKSTTTFYKDVPNIIICLEVFSGCSDPPLKNKWESESNKNELILYQCKEKYLISCESNLLFVTNTYLAELEMLFTWNCIKLFSSLMPEFWHETCPSLCKRVSEIITEWVLFFSRDDGHLSQFRGMCREISECILRGNQPIHTSTVGRGPDHYMKWWHVLKHISMLIYLKRFILKKTREYMSTREDMSLLCHYEYLSKKP